MDVCVCLSGADGRVVEGRATLFRGRQGSNPGRMGHPWMCRVVFVLCRPEWRKESRGEGGHGWPGKVPRSPAAPPKEKKKRGEGKKQLSRPQGT
jgi:hypothetical protein